MEEIARGVAVIPMVMANAYVVGDAQNWILIDSGTPGHEKTIKEATEARFGTGATPRAIVLTHGHFDHAGSSPELAAMWNVDVYAHKLELPYLTGKSLYPPIDTSAPGAFSFLARFFPSRTVNVGGRIRTFDGNLSAFGIPGWQAIHTPGHTPGHFCFFRGDGAILLAGDALTTMNIDNLCSVISRKQEVCRPPTPANYDWQQCRESVKKLAPLKPSIIAAGHGTPMRDAAVQLQALADHFPIPDYGRYVHQPAILDENGIAYLPQKPPDRLVRGAVGIAVAGLVVGAAVLLLHKPRKPDTPAS